MFSKCDTLENCFFQSSSIHVHNVLCMHNLYQTTPLGASHHLHRENRTYTLKKSIWAKKVYKKTISANSEAKLKWTTWKPELFQGSSPGKSSKWKSYINHDVKRPDWTKGRLGAIMKKSIIFDPCWFALHVLVVRILHNLLLSINELLEGNIPQSASGMLSDPCKE